MTDRQFIAYYRVSTRQQGQSGLGLDAQKEAVRCYLEAHNGILIEEYTEVESGKSHKNRPELQAALRQCKRKRATLLIAKLDRLARNVHFISGLLESRVDFVSCDNPHANKVMIQFLAVFAEFERDRISQRTKEGLAAAKARGVVLGQNGHKLAKQNKSRADRFAQAIAPVIEDVKADGHETIRAITQELNRRQIPTATEGAKWHLGTVQLLLKRIERLHLETSPSVKQ